jgi:hypothetical protein
MDNAGVRTVAGGFGGAGAGTSYAAPHITGLLALDQAPLVRRVDAPREVRSDLLGRVIHPHS